MRVGFGRFGTKIPPRQSTERRRKTQPQGARIHRGAATKEMPARRSHNQKTRVQKPLCQVSEFSIQAALCRLKPELRNSPQRRGERGGRPWERTLPACSGVSNTLHAGCVRSQGKTLRQSALWVLQELAQPGLQCFRHARTPGCIDEADVNQIEEMHPVLDSE